MAYSFYNEDRDKFLVEAMDEEYFDRDGKDISEIVATLYEQDFGTWDGFGHLFDWAQDQDWWEEFIGEYGLVVCKDKDARSEYYLPIELLKPDKFADAIADFLQEMEKAEENKEEEKEEEKEEDSWRTQ